MKRSPRSLVNLPSAFTLIELLVVLAIIGILIAILIPALTSATRKSHEIVTTNNMRQVGAALLAYAGDNQYTLPGRVTGTAAKWPELLLPYLGVPATTNTSSLPTPAVYNLHLDNPSTYPAAPTTFNSQSTNPFVLVMNGYNDIPDMFNNSNPPPVKLNRFGLASQVILFGLKLPGKGDYYMDLSEGAGNNYTILNLAAFGTTASPVGQTSASNAGSSVYIFADGSAQVMTQAAYEAPAPGAPSYRYGDWLWLTDKSQSGVIQPAP